jgi:predicted transcriptional regulator
MSSNAIVLSIQPQFAKKIFNGSKQVELRRVRPKQIGEGDIAFVYISSPVKALWGAFKIESIVEKSIPALWDIVKGKAGITKDEFNMYYDGAGVGTAMFFSEVWSLDKPLELKDLHEKGISFHPPQSFRYATKCELDHFNPSQLFNQENHITSVQAQ